MESQKTLENSESTLFNGVQDSDKQTIQEWRIKQYTLDEFSELAESISSEEKMKKLYGATGIRILISKNEKPPIQDVIDQGLVPTLIDFCKKEDQPLLQNEAAWILCNIASGTTAQTQFLVDNGGIPVFMKLLESKHTEIVEQAIFGLGNLAGESVEIRDLIIEGGGVKKMAEIVCSANRFETKKYGVFTLVNLCKSSPAPKLQKVKSLVPLFSSFLQQETNEEILGQVFWGLCYLSQMSNNNQPVIPMGVIPHVLKRLENESVSIRVPCLRIIGNIIQHTKDQTKMLINMPDVVQKFFVMLDSPEHVIRREVCWILSNIAAGDSQQIELVVGIPANLQKLIKISLTDSKKVQEESVWALSNATSQCSSQQAERLVEEGVLDCFVQLLDSKEADIIIVALQGIKNILTQGSLIAEESEENENPFLFHLEEKGADKIGDLQDHPIGNNLQIHTLATEILVTFCGHSF